MKRWQCVLVWIVLVGLLITPQLAGAEAGEGQQGPAQVVVKLRGGANVDEVAARYGAVVSGHLPDVDTHLLRLPPGRSVDQVLRKMGTDASLVRSESNHSVWIPEAQRFILDFNHGYPLPYTGPEDEIDSHYLGQWASAKIGLASALERTRGDGVVVAVLDTGIESGHPRLAGRLLPGWDFVDGDDDPSEQPGGEASGHGTFVSGIITLVAPDSKILPVRVLNGNGQGTIFGVAQGIVYAANRGAQVINLSLGSPQNAQTLKEAVAYAVSRGVAIVASVGNRVRDNGAATILYPAKYDEVMAVAATDRDDRVASFSNWGTKTDLCAPGIDVYSAYLQGGYAWWDGTSSSAAFVSGGAALVKSGHPDWDARQVFDQLEATAAAVDIGKERRLKNKLGAGRIDLDAATAP